MKEQLALKREGKRRCCYCKQIFPYTDAIFRKGRRACITCENDRANKRYKKRLLTLDLDGAIRYKLYQAKYRTKAKQKYPFELSIEQVTAQWHKQNGLCFYTGLPMVTLPNHHNYFSIDRYDSEKGYVAENIVLCCHVINLMKKDMSESDFRMYCQAVVNHPPTK